MKDIILSVVNASSFLNDTGLSTEFLLSMRPWEVGNFNTMESFAPSINFSYDKTASMLYLYVMFSFGGEPIKHLTNLKATVYKLYKEVSAMVGSDEVAAPNSQAPGVFVASMTLAQVVPGDIFLVDLQVKDPYVGAVKQFRQIASGV